MQIRKIITLGIVVILAMFAVSGTAWALPPLPGIGPRGSQPQPPIPPQPQLPPCLGCNSLESPSPSPSPSVVVTEVTPTPTPTPIPTVVPQGENNPPGSNDDKKDEDSKTSADGNDPESNPQGAVLGLSATSSNSVNFLTLVGVLCLSTGLGLVTSRRLI